MLRSIIVKISKKNLHRIIKEEVEKILSEKSFFGEVPVLAYEQALEQIEKWHAAGLPHRGGVLDMWAESNGAAFLLIENPFCDFKRDKRLAPVMVSVKNDSLFQPEILKKVANPEGLKNEIIKWHQDEFPDYERPGWPHVDALAQTWPVFEREVEMLYNVKFAEGYFKSGDCDKLLFVIDSDTPWEVIFTGSEGNEILYYKNSGIPAGVKHASKVTRKPNQNKLVGQRVAVKVSSPSTYREPSNRGIDRDRYIPGNEDVYER